jgi:signal transduction histidine kinase
LRRRDFIQSVSGAAALTLPTMSIADSMPECAQGSGAITGGNDLLVRQLACAQQDRLNLLTLVHHMRAPLTIIAGYADLMAERHSADMPDDMKAALDRIAAASQHLAELINSAFEPARAERDA